MPIAPPHAGCAVLRTIAATGLTAGGDYFFGRLELVFRSLTEGPSVFST